ncbi:MAG: GNAT family N-acetyltransferase [Patescibacteria group bacterium]
MTREIVFRRLTKKESEILTNEVRNTPNIVAVPINRWRSFDKMFVFEDEKGIGGVCALDYFGKDWAEIADFIVLPRLRGKGIGRKLFDKAFGYLKIHQYNIYIVSRNPLVIGMMEKAVFNIYQNFFQMPWPVIWHSTKKTLNLAVMTEFVRKLFVFRKKTSLVYGILRKEDYGKNLD